MIKQPTDILKTAATFLGVLALLGGVAFAAGNYPTRGEWENSRAAQLQEISDVQKEVSEMKLEQVRLRGSLDNIEKSQARTEHTQTEIRKSIDKALAGGRR
jgi:Rieske Fe-S protein